MANLITVLPVTLEEQLEALKGSIYKWQEIVSGTIEDRGVDNCPCCQAFYRPADYAPDKGCLKQECCRYCPIAARSERPQCYGTPYSDYISATFAYGSSDPRIVAAAQAELDFLQSTYDWLAQQTEPVYAFYPAYDIDDQQMFEPRSVDEILQPLHDAAQDIANLLETEVDEESFQRARDFLSQ